MIITCIEQLEKMIIARGTTVISKASSVGTHSLIGCLSWQGIVKYDQLCRVYIAHCIATLYQSSPETRPCTNLHLSQLKDCSLASPKL